MSTPAPDSRVPEKPTIDGLEDRWAQVWDEQGTYRFDRTQDARADLLDRHSRRRPSAGRCTWATCSRTPTPTASRATSACAGSRSSTRWAGTTTACRPSVGCRTTSACAATRRCRTTRPSSRRPKPGKNQLPISRRNFVELCERLTIEDEKVFEQLWRRLGLSVDWSHNYQTIDARLAARVAARVPAQPGARRGLPGRGADPVGRDLPHRGGAGRARGPRARGHVLPDRLPRARRRARASSRRRAPSCSPPASRSWRTPTTSATSRCSAAPCARRCSTSRCRCVAHHLADPEKGSGIAMICTFGDTTDVTWWRELQLPTRPIIGWDGRILPETPELAGHRAGPRDLRRHRGRHVVLGASSAWSRRSPRPASSRASPRPTVQQVKFYEKGDKPLEIVTTRQWYIRNGGRDADAARGARRAGRTSSSGTRRTCRRATPRGSRASTATGSSRASGSSACRCPSGTASTSTACRCTTRRCCRPRPTLPIDPSSHVPDGFTEDQRGKPGGFMGDPDIMDTWATSSLTPQIAGGWEDDEDLWPRLWPFDLRPQAHEIIRTWLFSSVVRAHLEDDVLPWKHAAISGWILDPDRKKMAQVQGQRRHAGRPARRARRRRACATGRRAAAPAPTPRSTWAR